VSHATDASRAPGFWNADFTLSKDFHVSEHKYFQFRWEIFNAWQVQSEDVEVLLSVGPKVDKGDSG
jgi:hypothetical protein